MKQFKVYKDIRKQALLMGLPLTLFSLLITSILLSLLVVIFSFSIITLVVVMVGNLGLYIVFTQISRGTFRVSFKRHFPKEISIKNINVIDYETIEPDEL